jgi:hypothetical protein
MLAVVAGYFKDQQARQACGVRVDDFHPLAAVRLNRQHMVFQILRASIKGSR